MNARWAAAAVLLLAAGPVAHAETRAAEVAAWMTGTFESKEGAAGGTVERIVVVSVPRSRIANGASVLYREQAALPKVGEPWFQRFYGLEEDGEVVRLRAFDPKDPLIVRGKWRDPSTLALYGANDVRERPGCEIVLRRAGERWEGGTPGKDCPSHLRAAVRMTSQVTLSKDELTEWNRGFDEKGKQTWGSLEGGTTYVKRSASAPADDSLQERTGGRREAAAPAPAALTVTTPSSPSKKFSMMELRGLAGPGGLPVSRLFPSNDVSPAAVVVVTSRSGVVSVFSFAESSSSDSPALDVSGPAPRLVALSGRGLDDVVSIELRVLAPR